MKSVSLSITNLSNPRILTQILVCEVWGLALLDYARAVVLRIPVLNFLAPVVVPAIILLTASISFPYWGKKIRGFDLFFVFGFAAFFILSWGLHSENKMYEEYWATFLFVALPTYFIGVIFDLKEIEKPLLYISLLTIMVQGVTSLVLQQAEMGTMEDNEIREQMNTSYKMLPYTLYLILYTLKKIDFVALLGAGFGTLLMLSYGSRGPIVCLFFFLGMSIFFSPKNKYKFLLLAALGLAGYLILSNLLTIALFMADLLSQLGMSGRIFKFIVNDDIIHYSGRDDILQYGFRALNNAPFFGYGLGGSWITLGNYSHNIALDIFTSFGYFNGSIILLSFFILFILTYSRIKSDDDVRNMFFLLLSCGFVKYFMSAYVLGGPYFFMLLGFCVGRLRGVSLEKKAIVSFIS